MRASLDSIERRIAALEAEKDMRLPIPPDRVEFARQAGLDLDPWQEQVLRSSSKRLLLNCGRRTGKTTIVAAMALHRAIHVPRTFCFVFSPSQDQSVVFCEEVKELGYNFGLEGIDVESLRKTGLELKNGSRIEARSGSERTARGRGADLLVIDEAARIPDELSFAVRPMLATTGGTLVMLSTPYGKRGVFYEEWTNGSGWERFEVRASECPRIPAAFLEEEREKLPPWWYQQEYECRFMETEESYFVADEVYGILDAEVRPLFEESA